MRWRERFRRLTFWNKLGAIGSVASIAALLMAVAILIGNAFKKDDPPPHLSVTRSDSRSESAVVSFDLCLDRLSFYGPREISKVDVFVNFSSGLTDSRVVRFDGVGKLEAPVEVDAESRNTIARLVQSEAHSFQLSGSRAGRVDFSDLCGGLDQKAQTMCILLVFYSGHSYEACFALIPHETTVEVHWDTFSDTIGGGVSWEMYYVGRELGSNQAKLDSLLSIAKESQRKTDRLSNRVQELNEASRFGSESDSAEAALDRKEAAWRRADVLPRFRLYSASYYTTSTLDHYEPGHTKYVHAIIILRSMEKTAYNLSLKNNLSETSVEFSSTTIIDRTDYEWPVRIHAIPPFAELDFDIEFSNVDGDRYRQRLTRPKSNGAQGDNVALSEPILISETNKPN